MRIETVSGVSFNTFEPDAQDVRLDDIAWATSRMPRFAGHTIPVIPYSVAQHAMCVADELYNMFATDDHVKEYPQEILEARAKYLKNHNKDDAAFLRMAMHGLLHDAAEAYIGDIASPVKHLPGLREQIVKIEDNILKSIYNAFNLEYPTDEEQVFIHYADMVQRTVEAYNFMFSRGKDWGDLPSTTLKRLQQFESPMQSIDAYDKFIVKFNDLKEQLQ